jgi:hypothetical protein
VSVVNPDFENKNSQLLQYYISEYTSTCCVMWTAFGLREEHRLRVFENRVLRRIFGPNRKEEIRRWKKLHKEELYCLCTFRSVLLECLNQEGRCRWKMWKQ